MARRKKAAAKENNERWLLTYADLITLLMVFFVLLFSMSTTDKRKFQELAASLHQAFNVNVLSGSQPSVIAAGGAPISVSTQEQQDYQQVLARVKQFEQSNNIPTAQISTQVTSEGIAVTISGVLLFYNGTDQIKPDGMTLLAQLGAYLATIPNPLRVEGHTDDIPVQSAQYPTNWELSAARAVAVTRYLAERANVAPQRLSAVGFGQYQPIVPNDSRVHREENRRAVIVILYGQGGSVTPTAAP